MRFMTHEGELMATQANNFTALKIELRFARSVKFRWGKGTEGKAIKNSRCKKNIFSTNAVFLARV